MTTESERENDICRYIGMVVEILDVRGLKLSRRDIEVIFSTVRLVFDILDSEVITCSLEPDKPLLVNSAGKSSGSGQSNDP